MSGIASNISARAAQLRSEFDQGFAEPPHVEAAKVDLLAIRVGAQPFAIRLSEIGSVCVDKRITKVPASVAALRGIAGFRGALLPVYDLEALLGLSGAQAPRWLVIIANQPAALAFDAFDGHLRVPRSEIVAQSVQTAATAYAREYVRSADSVRPILDLPAILATLKSMGLGPTLKEE